MGAIQLGMRWRSAALVTATCLFALLSNAGCSASGSGVMHQHKVAHGTEDVRSIRVGETTRVALSANPSTGFGWSVNPDASTGLEHVDLLDEGFIRSDSGLIGGPGRRWWAAKGVSPGRTILVFDYRRAWERQMPPAKQRTVIINVRPG